jgi:hypothetical protein
MYNAAQEGLYGPSKHDRSAFDLFALCRGTKSGFVKFCKAHEQRIRTLLHTFRVIRADATDEGDTYIGVSGFLEDVPKTNLITSSSSLSQGVSQKISQQRGLVNNEMQQPTIIQQVQSMPDPRIDKLEKRTKKIKDHLKDKGDTKDNAINVNSPKFQDAFEIPSGIQIVD